MCFLLWKCEITKYRAVVLTLRKTEKIVWEPCLFFIRWQWKFQVILMKNKGTSHEKLSILIEKTPFYEKIKLNRVIVLTHWRQRWQRSRRHHTDRKVPVFVFSSRFSTFYDVSGYFWDLNFSRVNRYFSFKLRLCGKVKLLCKLNVNM